MPGMFIMAPLICYFKLWTGRLVHPCMMMFMSLFGCSLMGMVPVMFMIHTLSFILASCSLYTVVLLYNY